MTYYATNDELYHYGVKGMKWGVRRYQNTDGTPIDSKKEAKREYKSSIKRIRQAHRELDKTHNAYVNTFRKDSVVSQNYIKSLSQAKSDLKNKKITKSEFKSTKKELKKQKFSESEKAEYAMAIGHYFLKKAEREAKVKYISAVKGEDSKAYAKAQRLAQRSIEDYGNYTIKRNQDNTFSVVRYDYVYM